jgi:hypothetical protein
MQGDQFAMSLLDLAVLPFDHGASVRGKRAVESLLIGIDCELERDLGSNGYEFCVLRDRFRKKCISTGAAKPPDFCLKLESELGELLVQNLGQLTERWLRRAGRSKKQELRASATSIYEGSESP